jgi:hypothetical protein
MSFFQNADIGIGAIAMMHEREKVLDFTYPVYEGAGLLVLMKKIYVPPAMFRDRCYDELAKILALFTQNNSSLLIG